MNESGAVLAQRLASAAPTDEPASAPPPLVRIVEALLFAAGQPVSAELAAGVIRGLAPDSFHDAVRELTRQYRAQRRPYGVQQRDDGYVIALKPSFAALRERLTGGPRETRLAQPTLDVLAVVAYRQPITRAEVDALRGHDSAAALRQLIRLHLIAIEGPEGRYGTTPRFLELFGLASLDDLPRSSDLQLL